MDVVAVIADGAAGAMLGSHLGREVRRYRTAAELAGAIGGRDAATWFVSGGSTLTAADLALLACASVTSGTAIGFLAGWSGEAAARAHAEKIVHYSWDAPETAVLWHGSGWDMLRSATVGRTTVVSTAAGSIAELLRTPHRFVGVTSHGYGYDTFLRHAVVCSLPSGDHGPEEERLPCEAIGQCLLRRHRQATGQQLTRLDIRDIAADVVAWGTCRGVMTAESRLDPRFALAQALAASPWVGALLTTYRHAFLGRYESLLTWYGLGQKRRLGTLCLDLNRRAWAESKGSAPWILLGDPAAVVPRTGRPQPRPALRRSRELPVTLGPGEVDVFPMESVGDDDVVVVRSDGGDLTARELFTHRPSNEEVFALHMGEAATRCTVTVHGAADLPDEYRQWRSAADEHRELGFTHQFLCLAQQDLDTRPELVDASLVADVLRRLMGGSRGSPTRLAGTATDLMAGWRFQVDSWMELCGRLLDVLVAYQRLVPGARLATIGPVPTIPRARQVTGDTCPYCGSPVWTEGFGGERDRTVVECFSCGPISDIPAGVEGAVLVGPLEVHAGVRQVYRLTARWEGPPRWRYCMASVGFEDGPASATPAAAAWVTDQVCQLDLPTEIEVPSSLPAGSHDLVASAVAHGQLWVLRRPVVIKRR